MPLTKVDKTGGGVNLKKEKIELSFDYARFKILMRNPRGDVKRVVDYTSPQFREEV